MIRATLVCALLLLAAADQTGGCSNGTRTSDAECWGNRPTCKGGVARSIAPDCDERRLVCAGKCDVELGFYEDTPLELLCSENSDDLETYLDQQDLRVVARRIIPRRDAAADAASEDAASRADADLDAPVGPSAEVPDGQVPDGEGGDLVSDG